MPTETLITEDGRLTLYPDTRKAVRRLNLRFVFLILPMLAFLWVFFGYFLRHMARSPHLHPHVDAAVSSMLSFEPWLLTAFSLAIYLIVLISLRRQRRPIVTLSADGIIVHTVATQVGLIPWQEIAEVRVYNFMYRYVGIVPQDLDGLCRRLGRRAWLIRMNAAFVPLYRSFGIFVAPINVPQEYLPISADELGAKIAHYRGSLPPRRADPGVWPPPPAQQR